MSFNQKDMCYTYFNCKEMDCIRRKNLSLNCWDIDDVRCHTHSPGFKEIRNQFENKIDACKLCIYYKEINAGL